MFRAILITQWKASRVMVLLATVIAFALPVACLQNARDAYDPSEFIMRMQAWAGGYALLSAAIGLLIAMAAWQPDHQGRHVYALSLPVSRAKYTALRFGAGALFLVPPVIALLLGALVVAASRAIPDGLHAYPVALSIRFGVAMAVSYALFFSIASATAQTAGVIIGLIAAVLFSQYLLSITNADVDMLTPLVRFIFVNPGILSVFAGRWMLVDV